MPKIKNKTIIFERYIVALKHKIKPKIKILERNKNKLL